MRIWQTIDFPADVGLRAQIGSLSLYFRRHGDEWQIATVESAEDDSPCWELRAWSAWPSALPARRASARL